MEKYIEIINLAVNKNGDRPLLIKQLEEVRENPLKYTENSDRLLDLSDDYMWLGLEIY
ncbi:hypothetical protein [Empedobacter sedimenti]|uniref:hypothetical protein n=1 Tax=Empedobacter sedimenti TaxID=3042610 RepID=UPI0024A666C1|nr:hypothetical protein [Empedobacter sedimenti]